MDHIWLAPSSLKKSPGLLILEHYFMSVIMEDPVYAYGNIYKSGLDPIDCKPSCLIILTVPGAGL